MSMISSENEAKRKKNPEAVSRESYEFPLSCVIMASGISQRFQDGSEAGTQVHVNKLLMEFRGKPILQWTLDCFAQLDCCSRIVVVREEHTGSAVPKDRFHLIWNKSENLSPSITIRKAVSAVPPNAEGCLFAVGDQPFLSYSSIRRLCEMFRKHPKNIIALSWKQKRGNPVIFPRSLFPELLTLEDGSTGRFVIDHHPDLLITVEAERPEELMDIDTREQYIDACGNDVPPTDQIRKKA